MTRLRQILAANKRGEAQGIYSCCSANEDVLRSVLLRARQNEGPVLIESTSNQVNQFGGYTGMTPADFADFVFHLASDIGISRDRIILGGDHLGPLPWAHLPEEEAMRNAEQLVADCVRAGYSKIHLDTTMRLATDDPQEHFPVATCAARGVRLVKASEQAFMQMQGHSNGEAAEPLCYVIGSEVPVPGGDVHVDVMGVTEPSDALWTIAVYREEFIKAGLEESFENVVALVLEMGIEFHENTLDEYDRDRTAALVETMRSTPLCIEGHSTDYQTPKHLRQMCEDGVAILKVGPAFTFAAREALFSLERIEQEIYVGTPRELSDFRAILDEAMCADPQHWQSYYPGNEEAQRHSRAFSFYDRARYYLCDPRVRKARDVLVDNLSGGVIPLALLSQYLPIQYWRIRNGLLRNEADEIMADYIGSYIDGYLAATGAEESSSTKSEESAHGH